MNLTARISGICLIGVAMSQGCTGRRISNRFNTPTIVSSRPLRSQALSVRFSPDSKYLMIAGSVGSGSLGRDSNGDAVFGFESRDKRLRLWNVAQQREIERLKAEPIFGQLNGYHMLLMPDFKTLVTTWGAWNIKVIDVRKRRPDRKINVHNGYISDMAISPDGNVLALGMTSQVQFLDAHTYRLLKTYQHGGQGTQVNFGSNSRVVHCTWEGGMKPHFVDVKTGKWIAAPSSTRGYETLLSPNKKYFVYAKDADHIELWKKNKKRSYEVKTWQSALIEIRDIQFSPNGKTLVVAGLSSTANPVQFFDIAWAK